MSRSIVEYIAENDGGHCGYCKGNLSFSHGMWAHSLTVADYQDLIDRGWRRSGKYCYKPTMDRTCCPLYTIRCRIEEFKPSKSQKKILKRVNKFLSGEEMKTNERKMSTGSSAAEDMLDEEVEQFVEPTTVPQDINVGDVMKAMKEESGCADEPTADSEVKTEVVAEPSTENHKNELKNMNNGPDLNKAPCKKAKQLRRERTLEKLKLKGIDFNSLPSKNTEKQIEDFINELPDEFKHKLEIKLVRTNPPSAEYLASQAETHDVYVKYQTTIHNDKPHKCSLSKFRGFLVDSPLLMEQAVEGPPLGYGSFHQQYWLSGRLIAVGVIDVLPRCVSSVYFFYDPQFMHLTMGTYGALREIEFTRNLHKQCPSLQYYYMGYYIHSCRKMRYKGNFAPSDLACPQTYKWFPIKECIPKLDISPYSRLDTDIDSVDENFPRDGEISYIPCLVRGVVVPYKQYKRKVGKKGDDEEVVQYSQLVGNTTMKTIILVRQV